MQQYKMKREQKVLECNNAGTFFNFIHIELSCKRGLGALNNDNGDLITDDGDRANLLNDHFASMCRLQVTMVLQLTSIVLYLKTQISKILSSLPNTLPLKS